MLSNRAFERVPLKPGTWERPAEIRAAARRGEWRGSTDLRRSFPRSGFEGYSFDRLGSRASPSNRDRRLGLAGAAVETGTAEVSQRTRPRYRGQPSASRHQQVSPVGAMSRAYGCLCRPRHLPWPAHPREKPGFSTAARYFPRETDCLLKGGGFELPVPRGRRALKSTCKPRVQVFSPA